MASTGYWWCPNCKNEIEGHVVVVNGRACKACGHHISWIETIKGVPLNGDRRKTNKTLPSIDEVTNGLLAIGSIANGRVWWNQDHCRCDHDVGFRCEYCVLHLALSKTHAALAAAPSGGVV